MKKALESDIIFHALLIGVPLALFFLTFSIMYLFEKPNPYYAVLGVA